jgi:calcineurin-like phosphoesterase family protein
LNGKAIHIIPGNHDKIKTFELLSDRFFIHDSVVTAWVNEHGKKGINDLYLQHVPAATWPHFEKAAIHLFGHIHSGPLSENEVDVPGQDLILKPRCYDVGVDNNDFFPIEVRDVYNKLGVVWK